MAEKLCPMFQKACMEHQCRWYIQLHGKNPNTGQDISNFGCAIEWLPLLLVENALVGRQTGAAIESLRNVHERASGAALALALSRQEDRQTTGQGNDPPAISGGASDDVQRNRLVDLGGSNHVADRRDRSHAQNQPKSVRRANGKARSRPKGRCAPLLEPDSGAQDSVDAAAPKGSSGAD